MASKLTKSERDEELARNVSKLMFQVDQVIVPAIRDIKKSTESWVSIKQYENEINGEEGLKSRVRQMENNFEDNKPGISLANKLASAWVQLLVIGLITGATIALVMQTIGSTR